MRLNYKTLNGELKKVCQGIFSNIYTSDRPSTVPKTMSEFVVVSLPSMQRDRNTYAETTCRFTIFVKDINGVENYTRISELQELLMNRIPYKNEVCLIWNPITIQGGSVDAGYNALHIQCNLLIY